MAEYPKRPPFFAYKYHRLMTKCIIGQEIGAPGLALCWTVAMQEDVIKYSRPVTFTNTRLQEILNIRKWDTFNNVRNRCIESGWLHYTNRGRNFPGEYWVTVPDRYTQLLDIDTPSDDGPISENRVQAIPENRIQVGGKDGYRDGYRSGVNTGTIPPSSSSSSSSASKGCSSGDEPPSPEYTKFFSVFWENYPRKSGKRKASEEYDRAVGRIARAQGLDRVAAHEWLAQVALEFSQSPKGRAGKFCPMAQTWLSQGRYDDDRQEWQDGNDRTTADAGKRFAAREF